MILRVTKLLAAGVLFTALSSFAAVPKISGTVTDLSGNPVSNSTVVIANKATHRTISLQTDEHGRFSVRNLKGNDYTVFVVADSASNGFRLQLDHADSKDSHNRRRHKAAAQQSMLPSQVPAEGHSFAKR